MLDRIADHTAELSLGVDFHRFEHLRLAFHLRADSHIPTPRKRGHHYLHETPDQEMVIPPSIEKVPPVTQAASSEAR